MKRNLLVMISFLCITISCFAQSDEAITVKKVYEDFLHYNSAFVKEKKGYHYIDEGSKRFIDTLLQQVLTLPKNKLMQLGPCNQLLIVGTRNLRTKKQVQDFDGEKFFNYLTSNGILESVFPISKIGDPAINSTEAKAPILSLFDEMPNGNFITFYKESDGWKLDFAGVINDINKDLTNEIKARDKTITEFVNLVVSRRTFKKVTAAAWEPYK